MKKFKKLKILCLSLFAALLTSGAAMAWGPERPTFTMEESADYPTFNSITNNNVLGDERNFVRIVEADTGNEYVDELKIEPGKEYEVYIFYHNNAKSSTNPSGVGIATDVVVSSIFPGYVNSSEKGKVSATITSPYANPTQVWDEAYFTTDSDVDIVLRYVDASAKIYNAGKVNGSILSEALFNKGVLIGINSLDGRIPGCTEYSGHIIYRVRAEQVGAAVSKTASVSNAQPGDEFEYTVEFKNTGTTILQNVTFHDELPDGLSLVPGTTRLRDSLGYDEKLGDLIGKEGYNIGSVGKGVTITLTYKVKVAENLYENGCQHELKNKIIVDHDDGEVYDSARVIVRKDGCDKPEPEPEPEPEPDPEPDPKPNPDPKPKEDCTTNPNMEGCNKLPETGPVEIILAIVIILGICGGGYYFYRTRKKVKNVEKKAKGKKDEARDNVTKDMDEPKVVEPEEPKVPDGGSQNPDNMVK